MSDTLESVPLFLGVPRVSSEPSTKLGRLPLLVDVATARFYSWRRRAATVAAAGLALVMAYGVVFGHNGLTAYAHKREEERTLKQQMVELNRENDRLRGHAQRLESDPAAIEHQAREELHYTRAGEVIVTVPVAPVAGPTARER